MLYVARLHIICSFSCFLQTATCALEMYLQYFPRGVSELAALSSRRLFETPHQLWTGQNLWDHILGHEHPAIHKIGWWEILQENPINLMVKTMVSG